MKITTLVPFLFLFLFFSSCSDDKIEITTDDILGKWETGDTENIKSVEFNESKSYIVVDKDEEGEEVVHYGNYEIAEDGIIDLVNYGSMTITAVSSQEIDFSMTDNNGNFSDYNSSVVSEVISSSATSEAFCKTWKLISVDSILSADIGEEVHVVFSQVGTYLFAYQTTDELQLSCWSWKDDSEEKVCYDCDLFSDCNVNQSQIEIIELTGDKLVINEFGRLFSLEALVN